MKTNKSMYFFAAALVAGTMGMTSCSNEEIVENVAQQGATTKVALGVSVLNGNGITTKAAPGNVNLDGNVAKITNIAVVPMIGDQLQNPIVLGEPVGTSSNKMYYKEASILQTVDRFRVYGNLPEAVSETAVFTMPETTTEKWENVVDNCPEKDKISTYSKPHPLYYYVDTDVKGGYYAVKSENSWGEIESPSWGELTTAAIGDNNRIKISGVTYAVGTLAAALLDGVKNPTDQIFFKGTDIESATEKKSWNDLKTSNPIKVVGITIDGQTAKFNESFEKDGSAEVTIYDQANLGTLAASKIKLEGNAVNNANIYTVVADEDAQSVTANFLFQNNSGYSLHLNNGTDIPNGGYFFLAMPLKEKDSQKIFEKGKTTIINATVTDWGKGTETPSTTTDVELGIEVEVDWVAGASYDEEI